jgi:FMN phosphatase YigB (HAD superfamily)
MRPKTKAIALDIYGTVLCSDDHDNELPPRTGLAEFILRAKGFGIKVISTSDAYLTNVKLDLEATFKGRVPLGLEVFDGFYQLSMKPKNYSQVISDFAIQPEELLIIGNDWINDFAGAPSFSSRILVPSYMEIYDKFDFSKLVIP